MLILHQQHLVLEAVLLLQGRKDFVSEKGMELFVLVGSDVKTNAARDPSLRGLGVVVDVLHLEISPAPRLQCLTPRARTHRGQASAETINSGAQCLSESYRSV